MEFERKPLAGWLKRGALRRNIGLRTAVSPDQKQALTCARRIAELHGRDVAAFSRMGRRNT
jgi:hypothetical protein